MKNLFKEYLSYCIGADPPSWHLHDYHSEDSVFLPDDGEDDDGDEEEEEEEVLGGIVIQWAEIRGVHQG